MSKRTIICDANILIDFMNGSETVLKYLCEYSNFIVADVVLEEVQQLSREDAGRIGIKIFDTPLEILVKAQNQIPGCSFQDTVCFLLAFENEWVCGTNDKRLRKECRKNNIEVVRGLRLLIELVENKVISRQKAISTAKKIAKSNREITDKIIGEFLEILWKG